MFVSDLIIEVRDEAALPDPPMSLLNGLLFKKVIRNGLGIFIPQLNWF